jgi:hypothetical protein
MRHISRINMDDMRSIFGYRLKMQSSTRMPFDICDHSVLQL